MIIGIPKEIKDHEYRIGATPAMVKGLIEAGHTLHVQKGAAVRIGFTDEMYKAAGAKIVDSAADVYQAEMIIKVKEPQPQEIPLLHAGQILFCYLHLAPEPVLTQQLLDKKVIGIAYETVVDEKGRLPLLVPMSEIAGRIAIQAGATHLQMANGGKSSARENHHYRWRYCRLPCSSHGGGLRFRRYYPRYQSFPFERTG
jgi:alanine dehydrogenase